MAKYPALVGTKHRRRGEVIACWRHAPCRRAQFRGEPPPGSTLSVSPPTPSLPFPWTTSLTVACLSWWVWPGLNLVDAAYSLPGGAFFLCSTLLETQDTPPSILCQSSSKDCTPLPPSPILPLFVEPVEAGHSPPLPPSSLACLCPSIELGVPKRIDSLEMEHFCCWLREYNYIRAPNRPSDLMPHHDSSTTHHNLFVVY